jgi:hypothetical protein
MPSVVQTQTINSIGFMLKDKSEGPIVAAFTAVNGRTSPPSPRRLNNTNGMTTENLHVRPLSQHHTEPPPDQKGSLPGRESWTPAVRQPENGGQNSHYSVSPPSSSEDERDGTIHSPPKRKRSSSAEDDRSYGSPESAPVQARRRLESYTASARDNSPNRLPQVRHLSMEHPQTRTLPPIDRADYDRNWPPRETHPVSPTKWISRDSPPNGVHHRDHRGMDHSRDPNSTSPTHNGMLDSHHLSDPSSTTEMTRAGVQVDTKKRKRVSYLDSINDSH